MSSKRLGGFAITVLLATYTQAHNAEFAEQWQASLCETDPPQVRFRYGGAITAYSGQLCYHYAGYNETCQPLPELWVTPATNIILLTPGQVPVDLLRGYTLLVRFGELSDTLHAYPLALGHC